MEAPERTDARLPHRAARLRRAALSVSQGAVERRDAGSRPRCAATPSRRSITSSGSGSSPGSSGSGGWRSGDVCCAGHAGRPPARPRARSAFRRGATSWSRCARRSITRCSARLPRRSPPSRTFTCGTRASRRSASKHLVPEGRFLTHAEVEWRRFDLYINGDPWAAARLRRCARRVNFFHGVAGKYDLDQPSGLPLGFEYYDHVAFINRDRMLRYLGSGDRDAAAGRPGRLPEARPAGVWRLRRRRPSAPRSGLRAGAPDRALRADLLRSLVAAPRRRGDRHRARRRGLQRDRQAARSVARSRIREIHAGIDWRARFTALEQAGEPGRIRFVETPDASPLLAAADCMVTDHSSIGFEYLVLDRPLLVFDAPDLPRAARINPEKVVLLRSAATRRPNAGRARGRRGPRALEDPARSRPRRAGASRASCSSIPAARPAAPCS